MAAGKMGPGDFRTVVLPKIEKLMYFFSHAMASNLQLNGPFQLLALDFTLDADGRVLFLESNHNPCFRGGYDKTLRWRMLAQSFALALNTVLHSSTPYRDFRLLCHQPRDSQVAYDPCHWQDADILPEAQG
jgi:hypothetical protein